MNDTATTLDRSTDQQLLTSLHDRLAACIADGTLTLPAQTIASSAVADLLAAFAGGNALVLATPRIVLGGDDLIQRLQQFLLKRLPDFQFGNAITAHRLNTALNGRKKRLGPRMHYSHHHRSHGALTAVSFDGFT